MFFFVLSGLTGLEPATSAVTGRRSNQLNYRPSSMIIIMPYFQRFGNIFILVLREKEYFYKYLNCPFGSDRSPKSRHNKITIL